MRLLQYNNGSDFCLTEFFESDIPKYAILSHRWGPEEVTLADLKNGNGKKMAGYGKIQFCGEQAKRDGLQYIWVDTCCIDKSNSTELAEAINSMFRWYQKAAKCYVYLSDVSTRKWKVSDLLFEHPWESAFRSSKWFTRGWTLQELLAPGPDSVEFFSYEGNRLGDKRTLEQEIHEITRIPITALRGTPLSQFDIDDRLLWAENRQTMREEDKAYSLFGIFDIQIPLLYGEGRDKALKRLREEIDKPLKGLDCLPFATDAPFNSFDHQDEPTCLPNTRVDLLQEIYSWADGQDERCIFWLNGLAGTGKSTVARTIARRYFEEERLGASFFFSTGGGDVSHAGKFFTSIATQLANNVPSLRQYIYDAIAKRKDVASQSLRDQWRQLILRPLSRLGSGSSPSSYVLIVDALDECDKEQHIRIILQLLAEARSLTMVRLRVFMTSRPEIPIRHGMYSIPQAGHQDFVLHNIQPTIVNHDISLFLEYNLGIIGQKWGLGAEWPGEEDLRKLVLYANGLFIWAATACRFIREGRRFARTRLNVILKGSSGAAIAPEKHLNEIYIAVLRNSISSDYTDEEKEELCEILKRILGSIITLLSPLSAFSLSKLLHLQKEDIDQTLEDLYAILDIPSNPTLPLRLHHPSFRDFLFNQDRCGDFWVDEKQAHRTLASNCIQLMSQTLKKDICELHAPGSQATQVESRRVETCLPPEVQYACLYWVQHLQRSSSQLYDNSQVHQFLQVHLLHWLEALGWMGKTSEGIRAILLLEAHIVADRSPNLHAFTHDARRFALHNRSVIAQAPLQLYCSALVFAPGNSTVRRQFEDCIPSWIQTKPKVQAHRSVALQVLEGHSDVVSSVAFSRDGQRVVSGSGDKTVRLWNTATSALQQTLEGHSARVSSVAFSRDGQRVVSGSWDKTARLWDAATGALQQTLEGHSGGVSSVAFSQDGQRVVSGSNDKTIRLWDAATGALQQTLEGHSDGVWSVAFSPDSQRVVSGSDDETVRLWDAATGALQQTLEGHSDGVWSVAFSPDSQRVVSGSGDKTVRLWDAATGALQQTLEAHSGWVSSVAFSPNGQRVVSGSWDHTIQLWDAATSALQQTLEGHSDGVWSVAFSPDSQRVVSGSDDETVRLWNTATNALQQTLEGHSDMAKSIDIPC
ncbi:vegetative incompatibility protein HET-E-1 [Cadophora sp. MPI-SDFR-AT-0126]|nr:vegetative incompatibility protein HET-E-1 [Leotiomycetes sp. MPI-SDFR-AT-0126]